jgi:hypothetical protein
MTGANAHLNLRAYLGNDSSKTLTSTTLAATLANAWHHLALTRDGNTARFYIDGVQEASLDITGYSIDSCNAILKLGARVAQNADLNGYMDEVRISKGLAEWTTSFTPPSSEYFVGTENMTLLSNAQVAESVPTSARLVLFEEDVDTITLNTDLKAYVSRDNGTTYSQVTLVNEGYYTTSKNILAGLVDISGQPSGTNMKYKVETLNAKNLKLHGTGVNWA